MSLVLIARWYAKEGTEDEVAGILPLIAEKSRAEPGCLTYRPVRSTTNGREFALFEEYADESALEHHRCSAHFRDLVLEKVVPLLEEREVGVFTDV